MKKQILGVFFAVALFCFFSCVSVSAKSYNVKLSTSFFSADASPGASWITVDEDSLYDLISYGNVEYYEEDILAELAEYTENDPNYSSMWEHAMIKSEGAWEKGALGKGITVAVIDSGANAHEELSGRIRYTYDYVNDVTDVTDNIEHGTSVAGVIAANRGNGKGFTGVAPRCELAVLKVADKVDNSQVGPYVSVISDAIEDAVDLYGCQVINLSLGTSTDSARLKEAVDYAVSKGAVVVAATGNDWSSVRYPARYDNVIGVGAVNSSGTRASFSNYGTGINVTAPGDTVDIISGISGYGKKSGTSFSTPYVSGICAAMLSADPTLDRQTVVDIIESTADDDAKADGFDEYFGYGIVDFEECIDLVIKDTGVYISKIDTEDTEKSVFVTNTSRDEESFILVIEKNGGEKTFENIAVKKGESVEVPLLNVGYENVKNVFAVTSTNSAFSVSENAIMGLSFAPYTSEKSFSLFVTDVNDSEMMASLSQLSLSETEKCNITVENGGRLLYIGEYYAPLANTDISFTAAAKEMSGYAKDGESFTVTLWGADTKATVEFVFAKAGDANEDGFVTTDDLVSVRKMLAGLVDASTFRFHEVNLDGVFNTDDLVILRKIIAGLV